MKLNNKGFTLVELIVVIAILGVLAAVLAPQYIQYVEKSRVAADKTTATTIEQAINTLCADGTISAAETFTWNTKAGTLTSNLSSGDHIANVTAITGTISAAKSTIGQSVNITYAVTVPDGVPKVTPTYPVWP